jgi:phenylacetate-CoA ligase
MTYERVRAAHLHAVQAAMEDHIARLDWQRERIDRYRDQRLRMLLGFARERSPFHARRLADLDTARATVADLAAVPIMTKAEAQDCWDEIVTDSELSRARVERILAQQEWYSYTRDDYQVFSSGGSSGVRGVYVWGWQFFVSVACLAWRTQARAERREPALGATRLAVLEAGAPPHASTPLFDVPTAAGMETVVIAAGAPFDEVLTAVAAARPTHLVGYPSVIGRLARAALAGEFDCRPVRVSTNSSHSWTRTARQSPMRGAPRSTTSGDPPRSGSRPLVAPSARDYTSARTRWCSNASMKTAFRSRPTNRRRERSRPGWPIARFPSSATTSATR